MTDDDWDPGAYDEVIDSVPGYHELQDAVIAAATAQPPPEHILELGFGTGETTRRLFAALPELTYIAAMDSSLAMVDAAADWCDDYQCDVVHQPMQDDLPGGLYEAVVSVLAVHHLTHEEKADLFGRVHDILEPGGRFVLGDVVIPRDPSRALVELEEGVDLPATVNDLLRWMNDASFVTAIAWERDDLAVLVGVVG